MSLSVFFFVLAMLLEGRACSRLKLTVHHRPSHPVPKPRTSDRQKQPGIKREPGCPHPLTNHLSPACLTPPPPPIKQLNVEFDRSVCRRELSISSLAILVLGSVVFALLAKTGGRLLDNVERQEKAAIEQAGDEKLELGPVGVSHYRATTGMRAPNATLPVAI